MTQLPGLESEPCSGNWKLLKALDGIVLDRKIHAAGWNFFFMATEVNRILEKVKGHDVVVSKSPTSGNPFTATTGSLS
ncbi:MAG: hypothetical protein DMG84_04230 [Acidobacteria bacterium]|nr:MAG: hypothetical protein DMG84_04230 [Acidobacteriota bacterium]